MFTINKMFRLITLTLISSVLLACSDKKVKMDYNEVESVKVTSVFSNFNIKISNPNLMTLQEIRFGGKRMGDFFKIENYNYKLEGDDSKMLFSKSYLIDSTKFNQLQALIHQRVIDNEDEMIFTDVNPVITTINLDSKTGIITKELDVNAAVVFEIALFKLLDGDTTAAPKAVKIPTH